MKSGIYFRYVMDRLDLFYALFLAGSIFYSCQHAIHQNNNGIIIPKFGYVRVDSSGPQNPWAKIAGDLTGNGQMGIIIGGQNGSLVWYNYPQWDKHLIVEGGYKTVDGEVGDLNNDGYMDVVMGGLFWYENPDKLDENPDQS